MQLHELSPRTPRKRSQRIARGGKRGTTSGRGTKGQKSRAGHRIRPALRDLIIRLPKKRGFRNNPKSVSPIELTIRKISSLKGAVNIESLKAAGMISKRYRGAVKIIGAGELKHALTVTGIRVSTSAKAAIEKAGGSVQ